jgi:DNA-binding transcriptional ArsR family regulator
MQMTNGQPGAVATRLLRPEPDAAAVDPARVQQARVELLDDTAYVDIAETFRVLADSTRAKIVHVLADRSLCVSDLAQVVGVSEPAVSQHLRLLRALRIVRGRRNGKMVFYSLEDAHVRSLLKMVLGHQQERSDLLRTTH